MWREAAMFLHNRSLNPSLSSSVGQTTSILMFDQTKGFRMGMDVPDIGSDPSSVSVVLMIR